MGSLLRDSQRVRTDVQERSNETASILPNWSLNPAMGPDLPSLPAQGSVGDAALPPAGGKQPRPDSARVMGLLELAGGHNLTVHLEKAQPVPGLGVGAVSKAAQAVYNLCLPT